MKPRMNEEAKIRRTAVQGIRDESESCAINDESTSSQLIADSCDLNLTARKKGEQWLEEKKSQSTTGELESVRLSVGRPDQDTLNNSSPRSSAGSDDRQPLCVFALRTECPFTSTRHKVTLYFL